MSHLEGLLTSTVPLEPHERGDLQAWLAVLEGDVELFGPTAEDVAMMSAIRRRLVASPEPSEDRHE